MVAYTAKKTPLESPQGEKKEKTEKMKRMREDEGDRYCSPSFSHCEIVMSSQVIGLAEERWTDTKWGKNMKHTRGEHRLGFRVNDSSFPSRDEDVCPLTRTVYYPLSASIRIKSHVR